MRRSVCLAVLLASVGGSPCWGEDPFAANVRPTDPLSPDAERQALVVPAGFEVQLVACEPQIAKPLNLAFDARGRLWVSDTVEYPYAVPVGKKGRDSIKVLEDADGDGRAEKVTTFAEGLNIPMGLYPFRGGVVAFSIPHIWHFTDEDGDGRADRQTRLFGPFDHTRDTHGLNNAFRRGLDGWLYACHGFNNSSQVRGSDGHEVRLPSGNTYRMRLDGKRIEHFTYGQVNPFGMAVDPLGNLFTADCHSKPVYQLLRGGHYPTFGPPSDPLGLVPPMMDHLHGSTAISGVAYYAAGDFPPPFQGNLYSGNVMTSRVNRNALVYQGSTILAREEPDFVVSRDPWFRPVDVVLGPDGALYVADFYNRIIGHYEVALEHPGRDRTSGRIWRIVYTGGRPQKPAPPHDLERASIPELLIALESDNLAVRTLATHELVDRHGPAAVGPVAAALGASRRSTVRAHGLWVLQRLGALEEDQLRRAAGDADRLVRTHAQKVLAERLAWSPGEGELALAGLDDPDAFVRRAAADALGRHPRFEHVQPLLAALAHTSGEDHHLRHTIRMALRDQLAGEGVVDRLAQLRLAPPVASELAEVALGAATPAAGAYLARYCEVEPVGGELLLRCLRHAARFAPPGPLAATVSEVRKRLAGQVDTEWAALAALLAGLEERGAQPDGALRDWAGQVVERLLADAAPGGVTWRNQPVAGGVRPDDPWVQQPRPSADGRTDDLFYCSLPRGEQLTGALRSSPFPLPERLSFYLAGHDGFPGQPPGGKNVVRLRDAQSDGVLAQADPPRNDMAQRIEWDLAGHRGRSGYLELVDGDTAGAYAWLAAGRFSHAPLNPSQVSARLQAAADLVVRLRLTAVRPRLAQLLTTGQGDLAVQSAAARALVALEPDARAGALAALVGDPGLAGAVRAEAAQAVARRGGERLEASLAVAMKAVPQRSQLVLAEVLAADALGAETLAKLVEQGTAAPRLLLRPSVRQKLDALGRPELAARVAALTAGLPSEISAVEELLAQRKAGYAQARPNLDQGLAVFAKHCGVCHQLDGKGAVIGPQLDGIGNRGLERVLEDLLDPNRNVDVAFRTTTLTLESGQIVAGLVRKEEGAVVVLVDSTGKEQSIPKSEVAGQRRSQLSLMPANVTELVNEAEFYDLVGLLLSKRAAPLR